MMDISKELIKIAGGADRVLNLEDNQFSIFGNGNKYGYKLKNSDLIIIPPIFDNTKDFSNGLAEGLAKFCDCHGRYGFINKKGIEVIAPIYSDAHYFREGLVAVCNNGKWGYIDYLGNVRIPFRYERCTDFVNGKADVSEIKLVSRDQVSYSIDKQGRCCSSELVIDGSVKKTFKTIWDVLKSIYVLLRFLR